MKFRPAPGGGPHCPGKTAHPRRDRSRRRLRRHWRHPAPRGSLFLDPDGLAQSPRRGGKRRPRSRQTRPKNRRSQPPGRGTGGHPKGEYCLAKQLARAEVIIEIQGKSRICRGSHRCRAAARADQRCRGTSARQRNNPAGLCRARPLAGNRDAPAGTLDHPSPAEAGTGVDGTATKGGARPTA